MQIDSNPSLSQIQARNVSPTPPVNLESRSPAVLEADRQTAQPPETTESLGEIKANPPVAASNPESQTDVASLKSESGSGNLPVKMASTLYVLNHSFDIQKQMLDILI